jgi:hypothetical protein
MGRLRKSRSDACAERKDPRTMTSRSMSKKMREYEDDDEPE